MLFVRRKTGRRGTRRGLGVRGEGAGRSAGEGDQLGVRARTFRWKLHKWGREGTGYILEGEGKGVRKMSRLSTYRGNTLGLAGKEGERDETGRALRTAE